MHHFRWQLITGVVLLTLSALTYLIHYALFHDAHHIFSYLITDLAFLPVEVLLVTMIIHQLLTRMESKARLEKLNMIIGVFFGDMGTSLLSKLSANDPNLENLRAELARSSHKTDSEFNIICKRLANYDHGVDMSKDGLVDLKIFFADKKDRLVRLMENPTLLEHESFTDLLMAVSHLSEELSFRKDIKGLPEADLKHFRGDIKRVYGALIKEWLSYMKHLKSNYPFLFSLAIRTNPFERKVSAVVME
jgi:hypothetical protein